jgi:hypothetical protein
MSKIKTGYINYLSYILGKVGPVVYKGKNMCQIHKELNIQGKIFE